MRDLAGQHDHARQPRQRPAGAPGDDNSFTAVDLRRRALRRLRTRSPSISSAPTPTRTQDVFVRDLQARRPRWSAAPAAPPAPRGTASPSIPRSRPRDASSPSTPPPPTCTPTTATRSRTSSAATCSARPRRHHPLRRHRRRRHPLLHRCRRSPRRLLPRRLRRHRLLRTGSPPGSRSRGCAARAPAGTSACGCESANGPRCALHGSSWTASAG